MALRATYSKVEGLWEGVVKDESGAIVWRCGHKHNCRDYNHSRFYRHKGAAMNCATAGKMMLEDGAELSERTIITLKLAGLFIGPIRAAA